MPSAQSGCTPWCGQYSIGGIRSEMILQLPVNKQFQHGGFPSFRDENDVGVIWCGESIIKGTEKLATKITNFLLYNILRSRMMNVKTASSWM
jgi:hypothetical protein